MTVYHIIRPFMRKVLMMIFRNYTMGLEITNYGRIEVMIHCRFWIEFWDISGKKINKIEIRPYL